MASIVLRPEPYDPDARDADGDGIVQERTPWERPAGTFVLDNFGAPIERGRSLTTRPAGLKIVDKDKNPVAYTPSYLKAETAPEKPGKGPSSPLSDHGALTLAERGLPTVRDLLPPVTPEVPAEEVPSGPDKSRWTRIRPGEREWMQRRRDPRTNMMRDVTPEEQRESDLSNGMNAWRSSFGQSYLIEEAAKTDFDDDYLESRWAAALVDTIDEAEPVGRRSFDGRQRTYRVDSRQFAVGETVDYPLISSGATPEMVSGFESVNDVLGASDARGTYMAFVDAPGVAHSEAEEREFIHSGEFRVVSVEPYTPQWENRPGYPVALRGRRQMVTLEYIGPSKQVKVRGGADKPAPVEMVTRPEGFEALPGGPDMQYPAEAFDEVSPLYGRLSNLVEYDDDQSFVRDAMEAFKEGRFSDALEVLTDIYGPQLAEIADEDEDASITLADVTALVNDIRGNAQYHFRNEPNDYVTMYRGGAIDPTSRRPVSFTTDREEAEDFGEVVAYQVPISAIDAYGRTQSYAGEYLVDPSMVKPLDEGSLDSVVEDIRAMDVSTPEGIRAKNKAISETIEAYGGTFGDPDSEYAQEMASEPRVFDRQFPVSTTEELTQRRLEAQRGLISDLKQALESGNPTVEGRDYTVVIDRMTPEMRERILAEDADTLITAVEDTAVRLHSGMGDQVMVAIPVGYRLDSFLTDGVYRTTHEVQSDHSPSDLRTAYERSIGIADGVPAELRPASGYLVHPDWVEDSEFGEVSLKGAGSPDMYGTAQMKLRKETSERAKFGKGDSLRSAFVPVGVDSDDRDAIVNALTFATGAESSENPRNFLNLLQADIDGGFSGLPERLGHSYYEALVPGSFSVGEVEEISVPYSEAVKHMEYLQRGQSVAERVSDVLPRDQLETLGLSSEEINFFYDWLKIRGVSGLPAQYEIIQMLEMQGLEQLRQRLEAQGVKLRIRHYTGVDVFDISSYRGESGGTVQNVLRNRIFGVLASDIRKAIKRKAEAESAPVGDFL